MEKIFCVFSLSASTRQKSLQADLLEYRFLLYYSFSDVDSPEKSKKGFEVNDVVSMENNVERFVFDFNDSCDENICLLVNKKSNIMLASKSEPCRLNNVIITQA